MFVDSISLCRHGRFSPIVLNGTREFDTALPDGDNRIHLSIINSHTSPSSALIQIRKQSTHLPGIESDHFPSIDSGQKTINPSSKMPVEHFRPGQFRPTRPALEALIGSYNRWEGDINRMEPYPARAADESLEEYGEKHNLPPPPKSFVFIANLPTVAVETMSAEDQNCSICLSNFLTPEDSQDSLEIPTRLPCGHIVGNRCLRQWVFPYGQGEKCPICRANCLPKEIDMRSVMVYHPLNDGQEIRLDEIVWSDHEGGRLLSWEERARLQSCRSLVLEDRLVDAIEELDRDFEKLDPTKKTLDTGEWRDTRARWERRKQAIDQVVLRIKRRDWRMDFWRMYSREERIGFQLV